jgi:hypothetical protein
MHRLSNKPFSNPMSSATASAITVAALAAETEALPLALASAIYQGGRDALSASHVYTKMRWASESDQYILFPSPSVPAEQNVFWTQVRITCSNRKGVSIDLCYMPPDDGAGPTHYVSHPLQAANREWTPLTWALPSAPMADQQLHVCVTLSDRNADSRPEYLRLDLLGFAGLYPPSKELGLAASEKGGCGIVGYFNFLRPAECVYLPLSGYIESTGLRILPPLWTYVTPQAPTHNPHMSPWHEEGELLAEGHTIAGLVEA